MSSSKPLQKTIVIVGAGFAGVPAFNELAKRVDPETTKLVLINPRSHFIHLPAACRLVVSETEPHYEDKVLLPFTARFNEGNKRTVYAKVDSIHDDKDDEANRYVTLDNGEKIEYTYLLLAPGSIWEGPLDFPYNKEESMKKLKEWHNRFEKATDIVLVGGGGISFGKHSTQKTLFTCSPLTFLNRICWRNQGRVAGTCFTCFWPRRKNVDVPW